MRIGLLGGRFDPIHNGHLALANEALKTGLVDEVWLVPANTHPWRPIEASTADRLAMLRLVETPQIKVSDIDIQRGGETFTIDTMKELKKTTHNEYLFIAGSDQIKSFDQWKDYQELEGLVKFLIIPRKGTILPEKLPANFIMLADKSYQPLDDSATRIRERIKAGKSISGLVPKAVEEYIKTHQLYV